MERASKFKDFKFPPPEKKNERVKERKKETSSLSLDNLWNLKSRDLRSGLKQNVLYTFILFLIQAIYILIASVESSVSWFQFPGFLSCAQCIVTNFGFLKTDAESKKGWHASVYIEEQGNVGVRLLTSGFSKERW